MISIETIVWTIFVLIVCAGIFALLFWAITYCESQFPTAGIFWKFARILLVLLAVFFLIGILLSLLGHPIIRWGP